MWSDRLQGMSAEAVLSGPAPEEALSEVERALGQPLPEDLACLLRVCNGVCGADGSDVVWGAEQIAEQNAYFRTSADLAGLYMPFAPLMFFGDDGGGNQFAFVRIPQRPEVFVWDHETDGRSWAAPGLEDYLRRALTGPEDWWRNCP